jgi:hypothetical protein
MAFASVTTSSDRIAGRFAELRASGRCALVAYVTAGHPDPTSSLALLRLMGEAGVDVVEVGVPFSDPIADGPIIQASSQRALEHGVTFDWTLELIARAKLDIPAVLFTYLNPFPENLGELLKGFETVIVPEINNGQLVRLIRDKYMIPAKGINKMKGRPFFVDELKQEIKEAVSAKS